MMLAIECDLEVLLPGFLIGDHLARFFDATSRSIVVEESPPPKGPAGKTAAK